MSQTRGKHVLIFSPPDYVYSLPTGHALFCPVTNTMTFLQLPTWQESRTDQGAYTVIREQRHNGLVNKHITTRQQQNKTKSLNVGCLHSKPTQCLCPTELYPFASGFGHAYY